MSSNKAIVTAKPTKPETSKTSILTKLRDCFAAKVSKKKYDSLQTKYNRLEEEHNALKADFQDLEKIIAEVDAIIEEADQEK